MASDAPVSGFIRQFDRDEVARSLDYPRLIEALRHAFVEAAPALPRAVLDLPGDAKARLVTMPAWGGAAGAVKIATIFPDNPAHRAKPAIQAVVILFDGQTGAPRAIADGSEITLRRTAAASALAADYLARPEASTLLMIGTGALAPHLVGAHAAVRAIRRVEIWGRSPEKARAVAAAVAAVRPDLEVAASNDRAASCARADIVCCATAAATPVLEGGWLSPGVHVDLVGGFSAHTREADDAVVLGARIVVDTRAGALHEAGDLLIPLGAGVIGAADIVGELADLCSGRVRGRTSPDQVTVFKSVGAALEDLAAMQLLLEP
ncbi:MAG TPA: ornithine cyclodeaminase family protein [Caulobacteraceae bacterium]|jgi:ornithine cyclodeaminase